MSGMKDNVAQTVRNDGLITITQGPQQQAQSDKPGDLKGFVLLGDAPARQKGACFQIELIRLRVLRPGLYQ